MTDHIPTLRNCPFCDAKQADDRIYIMTSGSVNNGLHYPDEYSVKCVECGGHGPWQEEQTDAVNAWNGLKPIYDNDTDELILVPVGDSQ